jgi:hypothetical protein
VSNFDELKKALQGTGFEVLLDPWVFRRPFA